MVSLWRFGSVLPMLLASVVGVCAQGRRNQPPWIELERELIQQRLKTDTASLIDIAQSDADVGTRWMAIEILGLRNEQTAKEPLERLLDTANDRLLKETAALALSRLGDARGTPAVVDLMRTASNPERQIFLAARLADAGNLAGYSYVAAAATVDNPQLRYLSVGALVPFLKYEAATGSSRIDPTDRLLKLLEDKDPKVRKEVLIHLPVAIAQGLSVGKVRPIVGRLAMQDNDESVKDMARLALISLGSDPEKR